jgi:hypothetical protein
VVIVASLLFSGVVVILIAPSCLLRLRLRGRRRVVTRQSHVVAVRTAPSSIIGEWPRGNKHPRGRDGKAPTPTNRMNEA